MEANFDVDKFISLVHTKESIWNYKSQAYGNKPQRRDDWISVCEAMIPDFGEKSSMDRSAIALEFQNKWKVLRDGFTRSIKNYKKKSGNRAKLYTYYEQLQFLNDLYQDGCSHATLIGDSSTSNAVNEPEESLLELSRKRPRQTTYETLQEDEKGSQYVSEKSNNNQIKETRITNESIDEDRQFLLSLLRDFGKIPEDQKLDAKGDIINVIRHYRNTSGAEFESKGSYFANDISALAATAIDQPRSLAGSSYYEPAAAESSRDSNSPIELKFHQ